MQTFGDRLRAADRLEAITQRVGQALWQLQELEGAAAQYFVLVAEAKPGMGKEAADLLLTKAQRSTFGATIHRMAKAGLIDANLEKRLRTLLGERNWLVHDSNAEGRKAVYQDSGTVELIARINAIADESNAVLRRLGELSGRYVLKHGFTQEQIDKAAARLLREWHAADSE